MSPRTPPLAAIAAAMLLCSCAVLNWRDGVAEKPPFRENGSWPVDTPENHGMRSGKLAELIDFIRARGIPVHSLMVVRNGFKIVDANFYPYDGKSPHNVASVTKSVMTTLIGIAVDRGELRLSDPLLSYFPGWEEGRGDPRKGAITIEQVASMTSGLACDLDPDESTLREMMNSSDYVKFSLGRPVQWNPGSRFVYDSPAMHLLSPVLQCATGQAVREYALAYLFGPLGISDFIWERDPQGYYKGWAELSLYTNDMAKLGYLFLRKGAWGRERLVSEDWVARATAPRPAARPKDADPYGYGWWIDPAVKHGFRAAGRGGQYIFVLPEWDMVIAATGGGFEMDEIAPRLLACFNASSASLAPDPSGAESLELALERAVEGPDSITPAALPAIAARVDGKRYHFDVNQSGLRSIEIRFSTPEAGQILWSMDDDVGPAIAVPVGFDGAFRMFPGLDGRPRAFRGHWMDDESFMLEYDGITNNDHGFLALRFSGNTVDVEVRETAHARVVRFTGSRVAP